MGAAVRPRLCWRSAGWVCVGDVAGVVVSGLEAGESPNQGHLGQHAGLALKKAAVADYAGALERVTVAVGALERATVAGVQARSPEARCRVADVRGGVAVGVVLDGGSGSGGGGRASTVAGGWAGVGVDKGVVELQHWRS